MNQDGHFSRELQHVLFHKFCEIKRLFDKLVLAVYIPQKFHSYFTQGLHQPIFINLIIELDHLLQGLKARSLTVETIKDLPNGVDNITDLVKKIRNAISHPDSNLNHLDKNFNVMKYTFCMGFSPNAVVVDGVTYGCDFHDDARMYMGKYGIYLKRNLEVLLIELETKLKSVIDERLFTSQLRNGL